MTPVATLHVSDYARADLGGQVSLRALVENLPRDRYAPSVLVPEEGPFSRALSESGVPWEVLRLGPLWGRWGEARRAVRKLHRLVRGRGIRILHADRPASAFLCGLAAARTPARVVWHLRVQTPDPVFDRVNPFLVDRVVGVSRSVTDRVPSRWRRKARCVYNGVDTRLFRPARNPGDRVIASIGQLIPEKGFDVLVRAARIVAGSHGDVTFEIIGAGSNGHARDLTRLIGDLGLGSRVRLLPPRQDLHAYYPRLTAFVLASRPPGEGFGRVLAEAMACGVPTVGTRVGGISEVIDHGVTGYLVAPEDPAALAEGISGILASPGRAAAMGRAGRSRAERLFSIEAHVRGIEQVFEEVVGA